MIQIDATHAALIGDALASVPYIMALCQKDGSRALIEGMGPAVAELIGRTYPFDFGLIDRDKHHIRVDIRDHFHLGSQGSHMAQSFFRQANMAEPALPITLDLASDPIGLPPGLVVSPFSRSDLNNNKLWPHGRWIEVIKTLQGEHLIDRAYVIGNPEYDDAGLYAAEGIEPVFGRPLAQVLHLIRQSPIFLSIDTGTAHLAHFGGVGHHVQLYPGCLPLCWAENPRAVHVRADAPIHVQVPDVLRACHQVLDRH